MKVPRALNRTAAGAALAFLLMASTARAQSRIVVIDDGDRSTRAATERLRGELTAAGFEVVPRRAKSPDTRDDVEQGDDAVASVRLVRNAQTRATEMWVSDRLTGKTLVRRVNADPERAPRLVALRGVELLRASLLELASPPDDDAPPQTPALAQPPPPEVTRLVGPPPGPEAPAAVQKPPRWIEHVALEAGIAVLASTDRLSPAATPIFSVWVALPASLAVRAQLVGPAFLSDLSNLAGSAVVRQELGTVSLAWAPPVGPSLAPFLAVGVGPYHLHVQGTAAAPYHAASNDDWALAVAPGLGVALRLAPAVALAVEGQAVIVTPHPTVSIGAERVASAGSPSLLGSFALVSSF